MSNYVHCFEGSTINIAIAWLCYLLNMALITLYETLLPPYKLIIVIAEGESSFKKLPIPYLGKYCW